VKRHIQILSVTAATALGAFVGLSPALAAPFVPGTSIFIGSDSNYWGWADGGDLSLAGHKTDSWHNNVSTFNTWDGTRAIFLSRDLGTSTAAFCTNPADLSSVDGDEVLTCASQSMNLGGGEFAVASEFRFFGDGMTVRMRYSITNTGDSVVSSQVLKLDFDAYQDPTTSVSYTDTDGTIGDYVVEYATPSDVVTNSENYVWVTDDRAGGKVAVVKYVAGQAGSKSPLVDLGDEFMSGGQGAGNDRAFLYYRIPAIAPGETVEYVVLAKIYLFDDDIDEDPTMNGWQEATGTAISTAVSDTELMSDTVVFVGIADRSNVLNWAPGPVTRPETLANTGASDGLGTLAIAALFGAVALVARRRSRS
jgi:LPXTG-motif cell wall-anchored protein